jgi:PmbA protein
VRLNLNKEFAQLLVDRVMRKGASACEVIIKQRTEFSVGVRLGEVETLKESTDRGLGLRVLKDGRQASVAGSDFSEVGLSGLIDEALELAVATSVDESIRLPEVGEFATSIEDLDLYDEEIEVLSTSDKITLSLRAEEAARQVSPLIVNFEGGGFDSSSGTMILANSHEFAGEYRGSSFSLATVPVAAEGGRMQRDYWYDVRRMLSDLNSPEQIGTVAAERTLRKLGARSVPTQNVPIVFEPNVARSILGDIFQAISGESIFRKASFLVGQLDERVASDKVTVIDDGRIKRGLGSRPFDAEGLPTRRTVVIRNGILENYLLDSYTARKLGMRSTGNASRALVGSPGVEPGNLFLEPGEISPQEICKSVTRGFLVTELLGFGVNTVTGDYSRSASGIWIENGEQTYPVQGVTIAGNLKEMLSAIELVGNDLDFRGSIVSPTILIGRMTVSA